MIELDITNLTEHQLKVLSVLLHNLSYNIRNGMCIHLKDRCEKCDVKPLCEFFSKAYTQTQEQLAKQKV